MADNTLQLLKDMVAIDSVNPSLAPGGGGESQVGESLAQSMRAAGMDVEIQEAAPGRPNVIGILEGRSPGRSLMFCGHMDTVGVIGMEAPFDPVVKEGRLYGRGSQDMKGGLAAMVSAARTMAVSGGLASGRVVVAAVADEEYASIGADKLVETHRADACVVGEPTDMIIAVGHKGFEWVEVEVEGRAAHGSRPLEGRDAILRMGRVLAKIETLDREIQARSPHPILGTGSLHASFVSGGRELSTYPDRCSLQLERRTLVGEVSKTSLAEVERILDELHREDPEFKASAKYMFGRPPYETPAGHELPEAIEAILREKGIEPRRGGTTFWTDAAVLGGAGVPSVVFGPGGAGLHSVCEYVLIDDVIACRDALIDLARRYCGRD